MKTVEYFICSKCEKLIEPRKGKIVQGNIYMVDERLNQRGGLVGNSFPIVREGDTHHVEDKSIMLSEIGSHVKEWAYHDECLLKVLYIGQSGERLREDVGYEIDEID